MEETYPEVYNYFAIANLSKGESESTLDLREVG